MQETDLLDDCYRHLREANLKNLSQPSDGRQVLRRQEQKAARAHGKERIKASTLKKEDLFNTTYHTIREANLPNVPRPSDGRQVFRRQEQEAARAHEKARIKASNLL